jgi:hypothetical protein
MSTQATGAAPLASLKPLVTTFEFMIFLWRMDFWASNTAVVVARAHEVVFTQVGAKLYFNNFHRRGTGMAELMHLAWRHVAMLAHREFKRVRIQGGTRRALHPPVLGALAVCLQADALAG